MRYRKLAALTLALALITALLAGCGAESVPEYTVTFDLSGGELVSGSLTQTVKKGESAVPPEASNGRLQLVWDGRWENVTSDQTVTARWEKVKMDTPDLAEYVQQRTVTVNVTTFTGETSTGSGFFIDGDGTIVTNFHVIDLASAITVEISSGATYPVTSIVDFSNLYDLAILKINVSGQPYLELADADVRTGEHVYAVGSALGVLTGSFTAGVISSTRRTYGMIECLQMDAAISPGNSGGPLVNAYGEVVGINTASYTAGENLNLAIKTSTLEKLARDKNWKVKDFKEWYEQESSHSWSPTFTRSDGSTGYNYSLVNNYQTVTGAKCLYSCDNGDNGAVEEGYLDMYDYYVYEYNAAQYDKYVTYLKSVGFVYEDSRKESDWGGTSYYYYNEKDGILMDLYILDDFSQIRIWPERG